MRRRLPVALLVAVLALVLPAAAGARGRPHVPPGFFGIAPQTWVTEADAARMRAGGIESLRIPLYWPAIQPTAEGGYNWGGVDQVVTLAARAGLQVLPTVEGTPSWLAPRGTTLPVGSARAQAAWTAFLQAAVRRYGPGGEFWAEHSHEGINYEPAIPNPAPIRAWQIWNEANFFYFAYPVSPSLYAKLVTISSQAIREVDPDAKVVLAGLFGKPTAGGRRGMPADKFLNAIYRVRGIKSRFDGVDLHPYAVNAKRLEELVEALHAVTVRNRDHVPLYITEMGWGSQNDPRKVAFEQGIRGQVRELRAAYGFLLANRRRLDLQQVDWFSWKDLPGSCSFCDSVGFFRAGPGFSPKPAWRAFVAITGGRP